MRVAADAASTDVLSADALRYLGPQPVLERRPDWHASDPLDASIGDLPEMRELLVVATRLGTIVSSSYRSSG